MRTSKSRQSKSERVNLGNKNWPSIYQRESCKLEKKLMHLPYNCVVFQSSTKPRWLDEDVGIDLNLD